MASDNYKELLEKINEFIRKFYLNKILRGAIYVSTLLLALYTSIFLSFFYFNPSATFKTITFYFFVAISLTAFAVFLLRPILALTKLSKHLSYEEASIIIGNHFANIKDKLLNTLQLHHLAKSNSEHNQLILASIDQKILDLKPFPFYNAVSIKDNRKYLKYLLIPLTIILLVALIAPAILKEGTKSFIKYDEYIAPQAPFNFSLLNKNLTITQGDDFTINLKLLGNEFPAEVYVEDGKNTYKLEKLNISQFNYTLKNIQGDKKLIFKGGGFSSSVFTINVKPRPELLSATVSLIYPSYLGKKAETIANAGDMLIPEGTKVTWNLKTAKSNALIFVLNNISHLLNVENDESSFSTLIKNNAKYSITPKNQYILVKDSLTHQITVIKDQPPGIAIEEKPDSISTKALYFTGQITDDYGFSRLSFKYNIKENNKIISTIAKNISINSKLTANSFFYFWNLKTVDIKPGQEIEYYFEVADNDGVNGSKITRSTIKTFKQASKKESADQINANNQVLKQKIQSAIKLASNIEKDSKKVAENLIDKKQISFEDKKQIEELLDKQKQLEEAVKDIKALNEKNSEQQQENQEQPEELLEKQKQIKELFDNVLDEKTKQLLEKLQQLMNERNKDQTQDELSKMQLDNKTLKNELDRILELYKQLEFDQNLQNNIDRLDELAKKQKELAEQSKNKQNDSKSLKEKQDALTKEMNDLKEDLKKLDEKNQSLDRPNSFENPEKETKEIQKDQQDAKDALDKNDSQKASDKQQSASEEMSKVSKKMRESQQQGEETENNINAKELRRLLENLLNTSFEQEKVMLALKKMNSVDPAYTTSVQKQRTIKDNLKTIADSLYSLSKRVPQIESTVNEEMNKINFNLDKSLEKLSDRRTAEANRYQQVTMTSINNLTLMLSEALNQLQNAQKNAKGGKGKKKQGMKELSQMQEQLNKNMQKAKEQMQKPGQNQGTVGKAEMSKAFGKMAQQQQMIRQALEKINREDNKDGSGKMGNLNEAIKEMKQTESDLVNKKLQQETMNRQKDLLTKLLEAEKAEREQDEDAKRESKAATEFPPSYKKMIDAYKKQFQNGNDILQKLPPNLNYYYKNKIAEYLKGLNLQK
ncbi:hypothetical protein EZJ43_04795 [Pedobacter changchengzhani]|uniref:DUF4175 family protein n=1 Tax=Pedobacter changchengzhani TaxID=2529274 RepID=A0A4R5MNR5_9SPHI|nr:DUF4175 family protein [Pedobacter changchengzhani]TDG37437.1 hypothetical protein EZJ43_04795 [Pedobacter changchengzhani]